MNIVPEVLARQVKELEMIQMGNKVSNNLSLHMVLQYPKYTNRKLLQMINTFIKRIDTRLTTTTTIKCLIMYTDTLNLIEEKVDNKLEHIVTGDNFLDGTVISLAMRSNIHKWDFRKVQGLCKAKDTVKRINTAYRMGKDFH